MGELGRWIPELPDRLRGSPATQHQFRIDRRTYDWACTNQAVRAALADYDSAAIEFARIVDRGHELHERLAAEQIRQHGQALARGTRNKRGHTARKTIQGKPNPDYVAPIGWGGQLSDSKDGVRWAWSPELDEIGSQLVPVRTRLADACKKLDDLLGARNAAALRMRGQVVDSLGQNRRRPSGASESEFDDEDSDDALIAEVTGCTSQLADGLRPLVPARHSLRLDAIRSGCEKLGHRKIKEVPLTDERFDQLLAEHARDQEVAMGRPPTYGQEYVDKARAMASAGLSANEIAAKLSIPNSAMRTIGERGGFTYPRHPRFKASERHVAPAPSAPKPRSATTPKKEKLKAALEKSQGKSTSKSSMSSMASEVREARALAAEREARASARLDTGDGQTHVVDTPVTNAVTTNTAANATDLVESVGSSHASLEPATIISARIRHVLHTTMRFLGELRNHHADDRREIVKVLTESLS